MHFCLDRVIYTTFDSCLEHKMFDSVFKYSQKNELVDKNFGYLPNFYIFVPKF